MLAVDSMARRGMHVVITIAAVAAAAVAGTAAPARGARGRASRAAEPARGLQLEVEHAIGKITPGADEVGMLGFSAPGTPDLSGCSLNT